ncbi:GNAT family N-acetyltransferase [Paenibacillus pini]|uniref:Acetyltransferase n=1 Tax=Paenibacillus pini JCM 16418 TaxID=1236976 RepID=W7YJI7_9BACL|nr:GNAT family N-acetyltransferase [Paenibacillus pini]GAF08647.1 acetyltransferase [Paenibacillus pini JCM 16418]
MFGRSAYHDKRLPVCEGERISLVQITKQDAPYVSEIVSDPFVMRYVTQGTLFNFSRSRRIVSEILSTGRHGSMHYGICLPGRDGPIGVVSFQHWRPEKHEAMIGYMLDRSCWGQGLATEALRLLLDFGFRELELKRIEGKCHAVNTASERVMQKNGMQLEQTMMQRRGLFSSASEMKLYRMTDEMYGILHTSD